VFLAAVIHFSIILHQEEPKYVCAKVFFLTTLCISQKPIYHVHENLNVAGVPKKDGRGKHPHSNHAISDAKRQHVITHIKSFPAVESHYCRSNIKRKYLESTLTLKKMYNLHDEDCKTKHEKPVKLSMYRKIFVSNFNYGFHVPKKDQCEKCYTFMLKKTEQTSTDEEKRIYEDHVFEKTKMRESINADRQDKSKHVLTFDLENALEQKLEHSFTCKKLISTISRLTCLPQILYIVPYGQKWSRDVLEIVWPMRFLK
jgi:hypothetical protein